MPTTGEEASVKTPAPLLVKMLSVLPEPPEPKLALIRSILPSPLTSAATNQTGPDPTDGEDASAKPLLEQLVKMVRVVALLLAVMASSLPSPLTSAATTV